MEWLNRMKDALDYMERHMTEPVNMDEIAKTACSSPFHFQRMFNMLTGVTIAEYIRKRRLTLAAQELAMTPVRVLDVALKYGYDSPEAFAKAFRKAHGITPSAAREPGNSLKAFPRLSFHLSLKGDKEMEYRIVQQEGFSVVGKKMETSCREGENLRQIPLFWKKCNEDGTYDKLVEVGGGKDMLGICAEVNHEQETLSYWIAVKSEAPAPEGFSSTVIPAATWAVFSSIGPMPNAIQSVWARIFQEWFPGTGYEHAGGPEFELYPPGDPSGDDYRCEVWIPVMKKS
ncbi:AraC family transcriptional regulator [Paenibacillus rhizophilus]|uniref:AraC family transcriptional regulator n=1 Tax=Paenibacillus rhizophilus TaxID=1850366 RepID=A0A3N9PBG9_9BACL|nr:AraC family transcriptional regulator [Paenibacillus rhizophilus]RQW12840.1 AraC family transcriptional regulator [Paenibacillus rhizophilus]